MQIRTGRQRYHRHHERPLWQPERPRMGSCHEEGCRSPRARGGLVADIEGDFSRISRDKPRRLSSPSDISITSLNASNLRRTVSFGRSQGNWGLIWHSLAAGRRCCRSRKYSSIGNRETSAQGSRFLPRDRPSCLLSAQNWSDVSRRGREPTGRDLVALSVSTLDLRVS